MKKILLCLLFSPVWSWAQNIITVTVSGTNTYTATANPKPALNIGLKCFCTFTNSNTGASTFNTNALGSAPMVKDGSTALSSGDIPAGALVIMQYNGTNWQITKSPGITPPANAVGALTNNGSGTYSFVEYAERFTTTNTVTTDYTFTLTDAGHYVRSNSSSPVVLTIPLQSSVAWNTNTSIGIRAYGSGTLTITPVSGAVTLHNTYGDNLVRPQYGPAFLVREAATDEWTLWNGAPSAAGTVTAVNGTAGQIASTGGTTPTISIDPAYVGQTSITTLGTLTTGATGAGFTLALGTSTLTGDLPFSNLTQGPALSVLGVTGNSTADVASIAAGSDGNVLRRSGTSVGFGSIALGSSNAVSGQLPLTNGGTNASLTASNGGILYSTGSAVAILSGTATANKMLLSGSSTTPTWSTSTIPTSAGSTANKVLLSDGTNYVLSTPTFPNASATSGKWTKSDGTNWIASTATLAEPGSTGDVLTVSGGNWVSSPASSVPGLNLTWTAEKTSNYTATASDAVPTDCTSGSVTVTLPTAPADKTTIAVKMVKVGSTFFTTIAAGGSDVFNKASGSTSLALLLVNQTLVFQYKSSTAIWYVEAADRNPQPRTTKTANYSIIATDAGSTLMGNPSSAITFTVDQLAVDQYVSVFNKGTANIAFSAGSGVTINGLSSLSPGLTCIIYWETSTNVLIYGGNIGTSGTSVLYTSTVQTGNATTVETDLFSYTLPAGALSNNGESVVMNVTGTFAATANNKRIRIRFGSTVIFDSGALAIVAANQYTIQARVWRVDGTNQKASILLTSSSTLFVIPAGIITNPTETLSGTVTFKITGLGTANNDITGEAVKISKEGF